MLRILVIDDDEVDREAVRRALRESNRDIILDEAGDAQSGFALIQGSPIDCVLLDFLLPDLNGLEFLKAIKGENEQLPCPVVMLTGEGNEEVAVGALKLGAYDYIVKNKKLSSRNLFDVIDRAIEQWNLIRDKKFAEEALRQKTQELEIAKEEAEKANEAKSEFLAAMSHDLRTPLNAIIGFSSMMRDNTFGPLGDEHYEQYAEDIHNSGTLLVSLINDVLDLSKIEAGKYDLDEKVLDISSLIQTSFRQLQNIANTANQSLSFDAPIDTPALLGDERALIQIFNNLLSNAIKFTPDNGTISVSTSVDGNNGIVLCVRDSGIGMSKAGIEKALKPFEQADGMHSRRHEGTGLGLHLCVKFMQLFGGSLNIESEIEKGTTVVLCFPPSRTILPA